MFDLSDLLGSDEPAGIPAILDEAGIARLFGVSSARVRAMVRDGILVRASRGRYDSRESLSRYLAQLREGAARAGRPANAGGDELKGEKLRLIKAQTEHAELRNAAARGELLPATEVESQWATVLGDVRAAMLAIPGRLTGRVNADALAALDEEIRAALTEAGSVDAR